VAAEVAWKQGHVVEVVRYKQIRLDQADAEVGCNSSDSSSRAVRYAIALLRATQWP
jgi:hypothetical protein